MVHAVFAQTKKNYTSSSLTNNGWTRGPNATWPSGYSYDW